MWNLQDAKNRFSSVVNMALSEGPQHVSRRGKPAVVVVSAAQWARLNVVAPPELSFKDMLLAMPNGPSDTAEDGFQQSLKRHAMTNREIDWGE